MKHTVVLIFLFVCVLFAQESWVKKMKKKELKYILNKQNVSHLMALRKKLFNQLRNNNNLKLVQFFIEKWNRKVVQIISL